MLGIVEEQLWIIGARFATVVMTDCIFIYLKFPTTEMFPYVGGKWETSWSHSTHETRPYFWALMNKQFTMLCSAFLHIAAYQAPVMQSGRTDPA